MAWGLRLIVVGLIGAIVGAIYLYHGVNGGDPEGIFADGLVKGPLGLLVGVALVVFGVRALKPLQPPPSRGVTWIDESGRPKG